MLKLKAVKIFLIVLLIASFSQGQASILELKSLGEKNQSDGLSWARLYAGAIGKVVIKVSTGDSHQSGFFINSKLFLTTFPTDIADITCEGIIIKTKAIGKAEKSFTCDRIREKNKRLGYIITEVKEESMFFIPVIEKREDDLFDMRGSNSYALMGYSPHHKLMHSNHCFLNKVCKKCKANPDINNSYWWQGNCMAFKNMKGGPLISKINGKMKIIGLAAAMNAPGKDAWGVSEDPIFYGVPVKNLRKVSLIMNRLVPAPTCSITSDKERLEMGQKLVLRIRVTGDYDKYALEGIENSQLRDGQFLDVFPKENKPFVGWVEGPGGRAFCSKNVEVIIVAPPTCKISVDKEEINAGEKVKITITPNGRFTKVIGDGTILVQGNGGKYTYEATPMVTQFFKGEVEGIGGKKNCYARVKVNRNNNDRPTCTLTATPSEIKIGETSKLVLTSTGNVTVARIQGQQLNELIVKPTSIGEKLFAGRVSGSAGTSSCVAKLKVNP